MRTLIHALAAATGIGLFVACATPSTAQDPYWPSDLTEYQRQYYQSREAFRNDLEFRRYQLRGLYPWGNYYPRTFYRGTQQYYYTQPYFVDPYYSPYHTPRVYFNRY